MDKDYWNFINYLSDEEFEQSLKSGIIRVDDYDKFRRGIIHWPMNKHPRKFEMVLKHGVDINMRSKESYKFTLLHTIMYCGYSTKFYTPQLMIDNGASLDVLDNRGCTPIDIALKEIRKLKKEWIPLTTSEKHKQRLIRSSVKLSNYVNNLLNYVLMKKTFFAMMLPNIHNLDIPKKKRKK